MTMCSIGFFVFAASLAIVIPSVHRLGLRQSILAAANLAFLATVVPNKKSAAALALFVVTTYVALRLVRDRPSRRRVPATVCIMIVAFLFLRRYTFVEWMLPERAWRMIPEVIGISYMLFKFIHMVVDQSQGQLAPVYVRELRQLPVALLHDHCRSRFNGTTISTTTGPPGSCRRLTPGRPWSPGAGCSTA